MSKKEFNLTISNKKKYTCKYSSHFTINTYTLPVSLG